MTAINEIGCNWKHDISLTIKCTKTQLVLNDEHADAIFNTIYENALACYRIELKILIWFSMLFNVCFFSWQVHHTIWFLNIECGVISLKQDLQPW